MRIFDLRAGCLHSDNIQEMITSVQFSDDENTYLISCMNQSIYSLDIQSGQLLQQYQGHQHQSYKVQSCYFYPQTSNNRHQVVSGSEDGSIFHWDLLTGQVIDTSHHVHRKPISSICCHPSQDMILTASYDHSVSCWIPTVTK